MVGKTYCFNDDIKGVSVLKMLFKIMQYIHKKVKDLSYRLHWLYKSFI